MLDDADAQQLSLTAALEKLLAVEVDAARARRLAKRSDIGCGHEFRWEAASFSVIYLRGGWNPARQRLFEERRPPVGRAGKAAQQLVQNVGRLR